MVPRGGQERDAQPEGMPRLGGLSMGSVDPSRALLDRRPVHDFLDVVLCRGLEMLSAEEAG